MVLIFPAISVIKNWRVMISFDGKSWILILKKSFSVGCAATYSIIKNTQPMITNAYIAIVVSILTAVFTTVCTLKCDFNSPTISSCCNMVKNGHTAHSLCRFSCDYHHFKGLYIYDFVPSSIQFYSI